MGRLVAKARARPQNYALFEARSHGRFKGRFQLVDMETGEPIKGEAVRYGPSGDELAQGTTDDEGYTAWTERDATVALAFALVQKENS